MGSDGKATYRATTSNVGVNTLNLKATVRNPLTQKVTSGDATYQYEVGRRSVAVAADKMNVFYIGVDNPITVSAAGVSSNALRVSCNGCNLSGSGNNRVVTVDRPGEVSVVVTGEGLNSTFPFRAKRIPDPVPQLGNSKGGSMGNGEFKAQGGVLAVLEGFDFDARCAIQGFNIVRVPSDRMLFRT